MILTKMGEENARNTHMKRRIDSVQYGLHNHCYDLAITQTTTTYMYLHDVSGKKAPFITTLFHGRTRTAYLYRCVWSGITGH